MSGRKQQGEAPEGRLPAGKDTHALHSAACEHGGTPHGGSVGRAGGTGGAGGAGAGAGALALQQEHTRGSDSDACGSGDASSHRCVVGTCDQKALDTIASAVRSILVALGEDPDREGLVKTPLRVAKSLAFLTGGGEKSAEDIICGAIFTEPHTDGELVVVKSIEFHSLCEHHMLPFTGTASVGYVSKGKVVGLSKVARLVDKFARGLQVQERLTQQIARAMYEHMEVPGVAVVMEASHSCMCMRGARASGSSTVTTAFLGTLKTDRALRTEFWTMVKPR